MNPFLLLAATTAGPSRGSLSPTAPMDILTDYVNLRRHEPSWQLDAWPEPRYPRSGEFYEPDGRLLHQYDRGPRRDGRVVRW